MTIQDVVPIEAMTVDKGGITAVPGETDRRTIVIHEPIQLTELGRLISRLPATYSTDSDGGRWERRYFHVTLHPAPGGGDRIAQFAMYGDSDPDSPARDTVVLFGDRDEGFRLGSQRRADRVYKTRDAFEADMQRLAGDVPLVLETWQVLGADPTADA